MYVTILEDVLIDYIELIGHTLFAYNYKLNRSKDFLHHWWYVKRIYMNLVKNAEEGRMITYKNVKKLLKIKN